MKGQTIGEIETEEDQKETTEIEAIEREVLEVETKAESRWV